MHTPILDGIRKEAGIGWKATLGGGLLGVIPGATIGAITDVDNRLRGAAWGAGIGMTGGALSGGIAGGSIQAALGDVNIGDVLKKKFKSGIKNRFNKLFRRG